MVDKGVDFECNWSMQSEALKTEIIEMVAALPILLTSQVQTHYPCLSGEVSVPTITFACQTIINKNRFNNKAARGKETKTLRRMLHHGNVGRGSNPTKSRKEVARWKAEWIVIYGARNCSTGGKVKCVKRDFQASKF
jgi:hypothetical protein